jgi:hypothetical protein
MSVSRLKAEHFAGDIESAYLAPAVAEELAGPNNARHELEKNIGGAAFAVNVPILGKMQHWPDRAQCASGVGGARSRRFRPRIRCRHAASVVADISTEKASCVIGNSVVKGCSKTTEAEGVRDCDAIAPRC